ncbi:beta-defensin 43-like [Otolemur garnettii]|uniref:beta-defensin 43-like n=1 Tax=Otolemur garnettii TaxID=30611 RepID=UPI000C7F2544|nr:beta-defensin 43-like [Otolemur garnettii]
MRILLCVFGVLALLSLTPQASLFSNIGCPTGQHSCRMKCSGDEYAVRYCTDWSICCRVKSLKIKRKKKWSKV